MRISVSLISTTAEATECVGQTVQAFDAALGALGQTQAPLSQFDELVFQLIVAHPLVTMGRSRASGRYDAAKRTGYVSNSLNYRAWIGPDWAGRVEAVGQALRTALAATHKARFTAEERAGLIELVTHAEARAVAGPPADLARLQPVRLKFSEGEPAISFEKTGFDELDSGRSVTLLPEGIDDYLAKAARQPSHRAPEPFKLYKRVDGRLDYYEAWPDAGRVVQHWGSCGDRGQTHTHPAPTVEDQLNLLATLKSEGIALGFKAIPISRHKTLILEHAIDEDGTMEDLDLRHALQVFMDEQLGWLGLGRCDGGSMGGGFMEVFCYVVDAHLARKVLTPLLAESEFAAFTMRV